MTSFLGESGTEWFVDERHPIGDPSGMGLVFQGSQVESGLQVAIKQVRLRFGNTGERRRRDREVEIGRALLNAAGAEADKDHLLLPLDHAYLGDDLYVVMPLAQGSLAAALTGRLSEAAKVDVLRNVAYGLIQLAKLGILHRDLKPANVLLVDGVWKLADFGISRNLEESTGTYTFFGGGTIPYMAPELWMGQPATARSDLYALGVMAYEILMGYRPFNGPGENEYREQHLHASPPPLGALHPAVARLVQRLLRKDPVERPQDARAVLEALDDYVKVLAPDQEDLLKALQIREQQSAKAEAHRSEADVIEETRLGLGKQGIGDLDEILQSVAEHAKVALPEVKYSASFTSENQRKPNFFLPEWRGCFDLGFVTIWFRAWPAYIEAGIPPIFGDVLYALPRRPGGSQPGAVVIANVLYEKHEGRHRWFLVKFRSPPTGYSRLDKFLDGYARRTFKHERLAIDSAMSVLSEVIKNCEKEP